MEEEKFLLHYTRYSVHDIEDHDTLEEAIKSAEHMEDYELGFPVGVVKGNEIVHMFEFAEQMGTRPRLEGWLRGEK